MAKKKSSVEKDLAKIVMMGRKAKLEANRPIEKSKKLKKEKATAKDTTSIKSKTIKNLLEVDLSLLDIEKARKLLKSVRGLTTKRINLLKKNESFAYAEHTLDTRMKELYIGGKKPSANKIKQASVTKELERYRSFWSSKTSSLEGAKEEQIEQSKRIFGVDEYGEPVRLMSYKESVAFWSIYDEFYNQMKAKASDLDSDRVQQILAMVMPLEDLSNLSKEQIKAIDFTAVIDNAYEQLRAEKDSGIEYDKFNREDKDQPFEVHAIDKKTYRKRNAWIKNLKKQNLI